MKLSLSESLARLPLEATDKWPKGVWDIETMKHGSMSLILFAPKKKDYQTPHDQDEVYFVIEGSGCLRVEQNRFDFKAGDALFVKAGEEHRFIRMSDDLKVWALFWGPQGGETNQLN
jgi:Mannose-6-phosphate isomerase